MVEAIGIAGILAILQALSFSWLLMAETSWQQQLKDYIIQIMVDLVGIKNSRRRL